jgi:hypothetical protein
MEEFLKGLNSSLNKSKMNNKMKDNRNKKKKILLFIKIKIGKKN